MKIHDMSVVAIIGFLCMVCVSCSRESQNDYSDSVWTGEYPVKTENGTTGELEDHTAVIMLYFQSGGADCIVETGIAGLFAVNRVKYSARWSAGNRFTLYLSAGNQSIICYSGTIDEGTMTLKALDCDGVTATYILYSAGCYFGDCEYL